IALEGDTGRGSLRSTGGFNLHAALVDAADLMVRYGGHAAAAGLSVEKQKLEALRARLDAACRAHLGQKGGMRELTCDAEVDPSATAAPLCAELRPLEPCGVANPEPLFAARNLILERARPVGEGGGHLQVTLSDGASAKDGIGFNLAASAP